MLDWYTGENLVNVHSTTVEYWGLTGKVTACAHGNASNILLLVDDDL